MPAETLAPAQSGGEQLADQAGNRFFDPPAPDRPEQVFGVDTDAILDLGRAATALGALPPRVNLGLYALPDAVRLVPLMEEMQSGEPLSPEDVRPFRKPIKKLSPGVNFADKLAAGASVAGVGIPLRRSLNNKIEREFPERAGEAIEQAREMIAGIEQDVDQLAAFDNPKEQFTAEVNQLADTVTAAIEAQRDRRVRSGLDDREHYRTSDSIAPKGMFGVFTTVVRKVRDFFGMFGRRNKPVNKEITAYDAGEGMSRVLRSLTKDESAAENHFPLLSKTILSRIPETVKLQGDRLALVAPEALNFLFSMAPDRPGRADIIRSVRRNPHELRFVTHFKKRYGPYYLDGVQRASRTLLPAIRDVLPSEGSKVRATYDQIQTFLQAEPPRRQQAPGQEQERQQPRRLRDRLKALFRKK